MKLRFVVFRYQPDLMKDEWIPLGVVTEPEQMNAIGAVCFKSGAVPSASSIATALLQDVQAVLIQEVESVLHSLQHGDDFLEELRARNRWNFHFTSLDTEDVKADDFLQASMQLFGKHVMAKQREAKQQLSRTITPRDMSAFEVSIA